MQNDFDSTAQLSFEDTATSSDTQKDSVVPPTGMADELACDGAATVACGCQIIEMRCLVFRNHQLTADLMAMEMACRQQSQESDCLRIRLEFVEELYDSQCQKTHSLRSVLAEVFEVYHSTRDLLYKRSHVWADK
jgi:hypothetical protein